jgi:hypothetical protein
MGSILFFLLLFLSRRPKQRRDDFNLLSAASAFASAIASLSGGCAGMCLARIATVSQSIGGACHCLLSVIDMILIYR